MSRRPFRPSQEDWRQVLADNRARESASRLDTPVLLDVDDLPDEDQLNRDPLDYEWEAVTASMESLSGTEGIEVSDSLSATLRDEFMQKRQRGFEYHECLDHVEAVIREFPRPDHSQLEAASLADSNLEDPHAALDLAVRALVSSSEDILKENDSFKELASQLSSLPGNYSLEVNLSLEDAEKMAFGMSRAQLTLFSSDQIFEAAEAIISPQQNEDERAL